MCVRIFVESLKPTASGIGAEVDVASLLASCGSSNDGFKRAVAATATDRFDGSEDAEADGRKACSLSSGVSSCAGGTAEIGPASG